MTPQSLADFPDVEASLRRYVFARDHGKALDETVKKMNATMVTAAARWHGAEPELGHGYVLRVRRTSYTPAPKPSVKKLREVSPEWYSRLATPTFQVRVSGLTVPTPRLDWPTGLVPVMTRLREYRELRTQLQKDKSAARDALLALNPDTAAEVRFLEGVTLKVQHGPARVDFDRLKEQAPDLFAQTLFTAGPVDYCTAVWGRPEDEGADGD